MRSIAVINQKGGVGKTTTAVNLSAALAAGGQRVQLIDLDPQAHASLHLNVVCDGQQRSLYHVLVAGASLAEVRQTAADRLALVPADIDLAAVDVELAAMSGRETILREKLRDDAAEFDYTIIDCPPSLGVLTINALAAVEEVLIPLQPHFLALHGLSKLLETIQLVSRRMNPQLRLAGVVLCLYEAGTRLAGEVAGDVEQFFAQARGQGTPWSDAKAFQSRIRRNIRLAEAPSFGQSIFDYAADSNGADDYRRLAEELVALHGGALAPAANAPVVPSRRRNAVQVA
jgi:chromosome partitioning protein